MHITCPSLHAAVHAQGSTCLEGGVYVLNYAGCHECNKKSFLEEREKSREEDDGEECISYKRMYV